MDVEAIIREYIAEVIHLSLATSNNNKPWVCEVHFAYNENLNLYYRSLASRRHSQEIAKNANVAGNIVKQHRLGEPGVGVYFEGKARLLIPGKEQDKANDCLEKRLQISDNMLEEAKNPEGHQFYKIVVENYYLFGSFNSKPSQKYKLSCK